VESAAAHTSRGLAAPASSVIEYTFVSNGRLDVRRGSHRAYSYRELVELIEAADFSVELDQPWTRDAKTVSFIATRR
jgi:hypothetical protein